MRIRGVPAVWFYRNWISDQYISSAMRIILYKEMYIGSPTLVPILRASLIALRNEGRLKKMIHLAAEQLFGCPIEPSYAFGPRYDPNSEEKWRFLGEIKARAFSTGRAHSYRSIYNIPPITSRKRSRIARYSSRRNRTRTARRTESVHTRRARYRDV